MLPALQGSCAALLRSSHQLRWMMWTLQPPAALGPSAAIHKVLAFQHECVQTYKLLDVLLTLETIR